jgi:hypothetical protein
MNRDDIEQEVKAAAEKWAQLSYEYGNGGPTFVHEAWKLNDVNMARDAFHAVLRQLVDLLPGDEYR